MTKYLVLRSTLEGIFGCDVGFTDAEATSSLLRDLEHKPFSDALAAELDAALADAEVSWQQLLDECGVAYFGSDEEARQFVVERIATPAKLARASIDQ